MDKRYRVIFLGLTNREVDFKKGMFMFGVTYEMADLIIQKAPVVLKEDMRLREARRYADAVQGAGGRVKIQDHGFFTDDQVNVTSSNIEPLENFLMCPQCGHKQLKSEACVRCGFVFNE
jgi:hypothetical protein